MKRIKLKISYDGTNYGGWQRQNNAKTIQGEIENCLKRLSKEDIIIHGAGRTDSGVHALCQVAHFDTQSRMEPIKYAVALNAYLPPDIRILESCQVAEDFHSRFSAKRKHYRYAINNAPVASALQRNFQLHFHKLLDLKSMARAAECFCGQHDFAAFKNASVEMHSTVRTIYSSKLTKEGEIIYYDVIGEGFLYNMVRIIAGTLIDVGIGKLKADDIPLIISSLNRAKAAATAPAHGLTLIEVFYDC